jgi:hypothetical protein
MLVHKVSDHQMSPVVTREGAAHLLSPVSVKPCRGSNLEILECIASMSIRLVYSSLTS